MSQRTGHPCPWRTVPPSLPRFAALTGHDEALAETARLTTPKKLLSDDEMASLTRELARVIEQVPEQEEYTFVYFVPILKKMEANTCQ